jgi:hypothetical protein
MERKVFIIMYILNADSISSRSFLPEAARPGAQGYLPENFGAV